MTSEAATKILSGVLGELDVIAEERSDALLHDHWKGGSFYAAHWADHRGELLIEGLRQAKALLNEMSKQRLIVTEDARIQVCSECRKLKAEVDVILGR